VKNRTNDVTRRDFLKLGLAGLGGLCAAGALSQLAQAQQKDSSAPSAPPASNSVKARPKKASVYQVDEPKLLDKIQGQDWLPEAVNQALQRMTGTKNPKAAWQELFSPQDTIGIKFDPVAAEKFGTTTMLAAMILEGLRQAGFRREKIMLIEGPAETRFDTMPQPFGYEDRAVTVHQGLDTHFARSLGQVTAILNVPFLKDHRVLGLSCGTVNMTLGLTNNPGLFLDNAGDPAIAELLARDEIRKKHRLTLVNGIRGIYDGGPRGEEGKVWDQCSLLMGTDVVAVDRIALDLIDAARFSRGLRGLEDAGRPPKYLDAAGRMGLGTKELTEIDVYHINL
jgi:hypothetical protein